MNKLGILFLVLMTSVIAKSQFKVVGYLPNFSISAMNEYADKTDFSKLTHLNIAFLNPDIEGNFPVEKGIGINDIVAKAHYKNVKVLLSLAGGSDQSQYANLLKSENRTTFITKIMDLVALYQVDGIDVDIEGDNIDSNYEAFVTELSVQLKAQNKLITGAVSWWTRARITDACLTAYDFINIMAYGGSSATHASPAYAQQHIDYWKGNRGVPTNKLVLGTAFYGRYDLDDGNHVAIAYKDLIQLYPDAPTRDVIIRSEDGKEIRYNGINGTRARTIMAQQQCGGMMIWQLLQDTDGPYALLKAIDEQIHGVSENETPVTAHYGQWSGTQAATFWDYHPGATLSARNAGTSSQSFVAPNFLALPTSGNVRAFLFGNTIPGGSFAINNQAITTIANHTGGAHKFAVYGVGETTPVSSLFFTLNVNQAPSNGLIILGIGHSSAAIYTNSSQLNSAQQPGLFTALQFAIGASNITVRYRGNSAPYSYVTMSPTLAKGTDLSIEVYGNNSFANQTYNRAGVIYTVPSGTYRVYINGIPLRYSGGSDIPYSAEIAKGQPLNSFIINGSDSSLPSNNSLSYTISNLKLGRNETVLPVVLTSFAANKQGPNVRLNWSTASETHHQYFELFRSAHVNDNFTSIHKEPGSGNTLVAKQYSYTDFNPTSGNNYYQLKQVDDDGQVKGIWHAVANMGLATAMLKAHVDSEKQLQLEYKVDAQTNATIIVTDLGGKKKINKNIMLLKGANQYRFDLSSLTNGIYVLIVLEKGNRTRVKLVVN